MHPALTTRLPYTPARISDRSWKCAIYEDPYASGNENKRRNQNWAKKVMGDRERRKAQCYSHSGFFNSNYNSSSWHPRTSYRLPYGRNYESFSIPSRPRLYQTPRSNPSFPRSRYRSPYQNQYQYQYQCQHPNLGHEYRPMHRGAFQRNPCFPYQTYSSPGMYSAASAFQRNSSYYSQYQSMENYEDSDNEGDENDDDTNIEGFGDDFDNLYPPRSNNQFGSSKSRFNDLYKEDEEEVEEDEENEEDDLDNWDDTSSLDWSSHSAAYQQEHDYYSR
ncbi:hypothetical protein B0J11DRAFT_278546 [Dendryphion nanum]|uniref:Uncharacterized protein n=1 Tax=Dendryphion nanum TaxID=256645 RepID=A0A9P9E0Z8_9PLEO|nr:hypothetical protein B0J11DRAFT_278546 [Dendryphion nanum]